MAEIPFRRGLALVAAAVALLAATGCAAPGDTPADALSEQDRRVIDQLAEIAPRDSKIEGEITGVECWKPSESMVDDSTFRVLCRLHYDQAAAEGETVERYRDMICIGDPDADPVSEYCYLWAYYSDMPVYEDKTGYFAS